VSAEPARIRRWSGEDVTISQVEAEVSRLLVADTAEGDGTNLRTSVMTHIGWAPADWSERALATLRGMGERHPSRTIVLLPEPDAPADRIDAEVAVECYPLPGLPRTICTEVVVLRLLGARAVAPGSIVEPLLIADVPVFLRWRGELGFGERPFDELVDVTDRLIVDSTEWQDLARGYERLPPVFERAAVSDIAWARTGRWRSLLASLWPGIAEVRSIRVRGTAAQAHLIAGWLRSRLGRAVALEHSPAERLEGIDLDGEPAPFPPGDPPAPSDLLSDELDRLERDPIYETAVRSAFA
jgi:hypothetical protein